MITSRSDIAEMSLAELESAFELLGLKQFQARQVYRWVYRSAVTEFDRMTDLSRSLQKNLNDVFVISNPLVKQRNRSSDGTIKFLLQLDRDRLIESVFIPDTPGITICISTQVGCAMQCGFCLTGKMGLNSNLTAGEIAGQVRVVAREIGILAQPFNVVIMGMGEPLHNYEATMKALRMLAAEQGLAIPARRVTLSTVGILPALELLAEESFMPNLAVSLHATTEAQRDMLVPVNRAYGLVELINACRRFPLKRRRRITFEYVLLKDINDTVEDAARLCNLLSGLHAKVNLIPLNEVPGIPFQRPSDRQISHFARILAKRHLTVSVRKSRGHDIRAACGQLMVEVAHPLIRSVSGNSSQGTQTVQRNTRLSDTALEQELPESHTKSCKNIPWRSR